MSRRITPAGGHTFGLLIPELGQTEIFEPICRGMAEAQQTEQHVLLWGSSLGDSVKTEAQVASLCRQFVAKRVSGLFFAPLELTPQKDVINRGIAEVFDREGIPIILLDRDLVSYPARSQYDLVGIDNRRAGYTITSHLLRSGCRRILFVARPSSAPTVDARIAGYREAMANAGTDIEPGYVCRIDPQDKRGVEQILQRLRPDGFVCANDFTAAQLLKSLDDLDVKVPDDICMAGIDDVKYANLLSVPLTTIHQPCDDMGSTAITAMMERVRKPLLARARHPAEFPPGDSRILWRPQERSEPRISSMRPVNLTLQDETSEQSNPMRIVLLGEVLWDVFPDGVRLRGAPLNFAAHASRMSSQTLLISAVGDDDLGRRAQEAVAKMGLETSMLHTPAAAFLHGFSLGWAIEEIAAFANRAGAIVASRAGAIPKWRVAEMAGLLP